jgi:hypothetical protein
MKEEVIAKLQLRQEQLLLENYRIRILIKIADIMLQLGYIEPGTTPTRDDIEAVMAVVREKQGW